MSKFKVKVSPEIKDIKKDAKSEMFIQQAEDTTVIKHNEKDKPTCSFTVPLNTYELELLRKVAERDERSMRYISRKFLIEALERDVKD